MVSGCRQWTSQGLVVTLTMLVVSQLGQIPSTTSSPNRSQRNTLLTLGTYWLYVVTRTSELERNYI